MTVVWGVLFGVAAALAIVFPLVKKGRDVVDPGRRWAGSNELPQELQAELESGVVSRQEYDDLRKGDRIEEAARTQHFGAVSSVDEDIERRVRQLRERKSAGRRPTPDRGGGATRDSTFADRCPKCGKQVRPRDKFCVACGMRLGGSSR